MRYFILLAGTSMLAACGGGGGVQSASGTPPNAPAHSFVNPGEVKTYSAVGAGHSYAYTVVENSNGHSGQLYAGNANTVRNSGIEITYDPRDAIFTISVDQERAGIQPLGAPRFQDPAHRTDFGGAASPQGGTPELSATDIRYLEVASGTIENVAFAGQHDLLPFLVNGQDGGSYDATTFFYQKPGTETKYVTFAGYLRNIVTHTRVEYPDGQFGPNGEENFVQSDIELERAAFAFGEMTRNNNVPNTGTGRFEGEMLASMVFNDTRDTQANFNSYFQWLEGRATTTVNFGAGTFDVRLAANALAPQFDPFTNAPNSIVAGSAFTATGSGLIDLVSKGGFFGEFDRAFFVNPNGTRYNVTIEGSSVDGAFYGPNAEEIGAGFRIVGGVPDERVDIIGTFVGKK